MNTTLLVIGYGITIVGSAICGGYLPRLVRMNHVRMQILLSFVGGMMLGVSVLHLLPHGLEQIQSALLAEAARSADAATTPPPQAWAHAMPYMLLGLLVTFFLMRTFHFHQHGDEPECDQTHDHDHAGTAAHTHHHHGPPVSRVGPWGVLFGLALHTFMDGVALGAAALVMHPGAIPAGFGVYLAILLHKPLDGLSLASLMSTEHYSWRSIVLANALVGSTCLLGALAVTLWPALAEGGFLLGYLLSAAAGVFLCISLSDLLPEVQFHQHDRLPLSTALLLGIGVAYLIEASHVH